MRLTKCYVQSQISDRAFLKYSWKFSQGTGPSGFKSRSKKLQMPYYFCSLEKLFIFTYSFIYAADLPFHDILHSKYKKW